MKKCFVLFISISIALIMTSCSETDDLSLTESTSSRSLNSVLDSTIVDYPTEIDSYISQNYPDDPIHEIEVDSIGNFEVELESGLELLFDSTGTFIEELPMEMEDEDMDDEKEDEDESEGEEDDDEEDDLDEYVTDYPSTIDNYVAANHPGATIVEVELDDDGTYEVELDDETEIVFDSEGNFVEYDD